MNNLKIGFIGGGNMATSLISGLISANQNPNSIFVLDNNQDKLNFLKETYKINATKTEEIAKICDVIILAIKPQSLESISNTIKNDILNKNSLIISILAGVNTSRLQEIFGAKTKIVRAMPNTPALIQCGASGLFANNNINQEQKNIAENILRASGLIVWVDTEDKMDIIGAISGSGPAYFFLFMEILSKFGEENGLRKKDSKLLSITTSLGAAKMALESNLELSTLRENVTSKNGITEAALNSLKNSNFENIIKKALKENIDKAKELAKL